MDFSWGLKLYLDRTAAQRALTDDEQRIREIIEWPDSPRKKRVLRRMERHARVELELDEEALDWSKIDWLKVVQFIAAILTILMFFLDEGPGDAHP
jgi:hypothetical protein